MIMGDFNAQNPLWVATKLQIKEEKEKTSCHISTHALTMMVQTQIYILAMVFYS